MRKKRAFGAGTFRRALCVSAGPGERRGNLSASRRRFRGPGLHSALCPSQGPPFPKTERPHAPAPGTPSGARNSPE